MLEENYILVGVCYGEWKHRKSGTSWKEIIRRKADYFISTSDSLEDFLYQLEQHGFTVKHGKYISVKLSEHQRFVRLKTLGDNYSQVSIAQRIQAQLNTLPKVKTVVEIVLETVDKFGYETRKISFVQSVKDTIFILENQLNAINEAGVSSILDVKNKVVGIKNKVRKTQKQLDDLQSNFINNYDEIILLKNALEALKNKEGVYKSIIETCSNEDYISRLVRLARAKMTEQENEILRALQQEKYIVYCLQMAEQLPYKK